MATTFEKIEADKRTVSDRLDDRKLGLEYVDLIEQTKPAGLAVAHLNQDVQHQGGH